MVVGEAWERTAMLVVMLGPQVLDAGKNNLVSNNDRVLSVCRNEQCSSVLTIVCFHVYLLAVTSFDFHPSFQLFLFISLRIDFHWVIFSWQNFAL